MVSPVIDGSYCRMSSTVEALDSHGYPPALTAGK